MPEKAEPVAAKEVEEFPRPLVGVGLKVGSIAAFLGMATCIKEVGDVVPAGEIVFFRASMAMVPILVYLGIRGQLHTAFRTKNLLSHVWRGLIGVSAMSFGFYGLTRLPLPDATALGYAKPLIMVLLAAWLLGETVRIYRMSAVIVGLIGVVIISWPKLTLFNSDNWQDGQALGVLATLASAVLASFAMVLVRRLVQTEKTPTIVLYFSLSASLLALGTAPFGWIALDTFHLTLLVSAGFFGGIGQILLTQSYRFAEVSTIAPFEYTSIIGAIVIGYFLFADVPEISMLAGTAIVIAAGIFIIMREHRLGLERKSVRRFGTPNSQSLSRSDRIVGWRKPVQSTRRAHDAPQRVDGDQAAVASMSDMFVFERHGTEYRVPKKVPLFTSPRKRYEVCPYHVAVDRDLRSRLLARLERTRFNTHREYRIDRPTLKRPPKSNAAAPDKPERQVRIGDVAASAGVSVGTVSNVINGRGNVSAKRRALVEKAIKDLSFSGSLLAKGMRSQRFPVVGLCVPNATSSNFVMMSDAIEADAASAGFELVQVITRHDPAREMGRVERLIASRASGVMLLPSAQADALIERLQAVKMPMVAINHFAGTSAVDHVYVDHRAAFREAACRLAEGGYEELVVVSQFPTFAVVQENVAGLREGIAASGRNVKLTTLKAGATQEACQKALEKALSSYKVRKMAVVASSDLLAAWSIEAFRALDIAFPDQIGLLCAEEPRWARATWPMLSCIQQPTAELAQVAWDMLKARIEGSKAPPATYRCTPNVNFRGSLRLQGT